MAARETVDDPVALGSQALADAIEQQAATAEILRIISRSPADAQPVFEAIVNAGVLLFKGAAVAISRHEGDTVRSVAIAEEDPVRAERWRKVFPFPLSREYIHGAAILDCRVVDVPDVQVVGGQFEAGKRNLAPSGYRAMTVVPLVRDGVAIGAIAVVRMTPGALSDRQISLLQTFANQAVIAIENVRLVTELGARNRELTEALEQQTATSEILRVISRSPTDVQAVFDTIAAAARKLCKPRSANVFTFDGHLIHAAALTIADPDGLAAVRKAFPRPPGRELAVPRAILTRAVVEIRDVREDPDVLDQQVAAAANIRSVLAVPLLRNGEPLGAIAIGKPEPGPFPPKQVALLQTFADQAVIAIENVRLFNETQEALAHQTATSDVLQVISGSMADARPVFEKILDSCAQLFGATDLGVFLVDGQDRLNVGAYRGSFADWAPGAYPRPLAGTMSEMVMRRGALMHWGDVAQALDIPDYIREVVRQGGNFAVAVAPLVWEGQSIGTIDVMRKPPRPYSEKELALLATFADQAVIAIQNARHFNETQEALARQTATSDVLRVISRSVTDTQPVFDTIAERATRLTGANSGWVFRYDGEWIHGASAYGLSPEALALALTYFPMRPSGASYTARAIRDGAVVNVADALAETDPAYVTKPVARAAGYRSVLSVPMFRGGQVVGAISVNRADVGLFGETEVELLKTFADQAVIAIENVRLFNETKEALEQQTATSEILRVISGSRTSTAPVFDAILAAGARLCEADFGMVVRYEGDQFAAVATTLIPDPAFEAYMREPRHWGPSTGLGRLVATLHAVNIPDLLDDAAWRERNPERIRAVKLGGVRSWLGVPILREGDLIGAILVYRKEVRPFADGQTALLQTFADQAVIAIENVRLFNEREARNRELAEALEQQTATSEILRVISMSPTDVQPVFDTIVTHAVRLCSGQFAFVMLHDGERLVLAAHTPCSDEFAAYLGRGLPLDTATTSGRAALAHEPVQVLDFLAELGTGVTSAHRSEGVRTVLAVPMLRGDQLVGVVAVWRHEVRAFAPEQVALLKTFADQAVIAIMNVRLFHEREARNRELAEALEQQTATSEILRAISRSPTDVRPVFQTIADAALRLCDASVANMLTCDAGLLHIGALAGLDGKGLAAVHAIFPRPPARDTAAGMAVLTREVFVIEDVLADPAYACMAGPDWSVRSVLGIPLLRQGTPIGALAICRPVTGPFPDKLVALLRIFADQAVIAIENVRLFNALQDKTRELEVASRHKNAFLANMSHELRTPMNAILGFTRIVLRETRERIDRKQAENLEKILASARHLVGLINATLDLTRIEAGRIEITPSDITLAPLLDECLRSVEPLLADGVGLDCRIAPELPPMRVDAGKLRQIVINLLSNAIKFTERGRIDVRASRYGDRVEIEVADSGIGVPADKLEAIFEEFEQVDASHTRAHGGTGLGLAIARRLARAMGGELSARSALGAGSTFRLNLPLHYRDPDEA